jgi:Zn finger protein HypA/HybF involved in hydrogenase expression
MDELKLDGNAAAGTLQQIFAFEVTTAVGTCARCGTAGPIGQASVYAPAMGMVVRCPACESVLFRVANDGAGRYWFEMMGVRCLELRAST